MKVQIIVDSTVDMPEHSRSACRVVPLTVHFGEESFIDGWALSPDGEIAYSAEQLPSVPEGTVLYAIYSAETDAEA